MPITQSRKRNSIKNNNINIYRDRERKKSMRRTKKILIGGKSKFKPPSAGPVKQQDSKVMSQTHKSAYSMSPIRMRHVNKFQKNANNAAKTEASKAASKAAKLARNYALRSKELEHHSKSQLDKIARLFHEKSNEFKKQFTNNIAAKTAMREATLKKLYQDRKNTGNGYFPPLPPPLPPRNKPNESNSVTKMVYNAKSRSMPTTDNGGKPFDHLKLYVEKNNPKTSLYNVLHRNNTSAKNNTSSTPNVYDKMSPHSSQTYSSSFY